MADMANKHAHAQNKPCTFYIVRHGQTIWNVQRRIQGHSDTPLTEEGIRDAHELAKTFQHIDFAAAYSSDLLRAKRTAEIVIADHQLLVKTNQLLREQYFGKYEGANVEQYRTELGQLLEKRRQLTFEENLHLSIGEGIETHAEVTTRMITFLREAAAAHAGQNVLIVSHGAMIRAFLVRIGAFSYAESETVRIKNLGYAIVEADASEFVVKELVGIDTHDGPWTDEPKRPVLEETSCVPCRGGEEPLSATEVKLYQESVPSWKLDESNEHPQLVRELKLADFKACLALVAAIGELAEREGHHPNLYVHGYRHLRIEIFTHKTSGLHLNDFILARKIDLLPELARK